MSSCCDAGPALKQRTAILAAAIAAAAVLAQGTAAEIAAARGADSLAFAPSLSSRLIDADADRDRPPRRGNVWGGPYTASTGETVTVFPSDVVPAGAGDGATLGRLPRRSRTAPSSRISGRTSCRCARCRRTAAARRSPATAPATGRLVAPGETTTTEASTEGIIAHEYGHHVAASRNNAPWDAVDYGTKRWATYMQVCARTESGEFYRPVTSRSPTTA